MKRTETTGLLELIYEAQRGRQESFTALAKLTEPKVYTYVYRTTLDHHLSQDLCQEALLEMVRSLPKAEVTCEEAFWAWLYRVALNKVRHHFRVQGNKRIDQRTHVNTDLLRGHQGHTSDTGLDHLIKADVIKAVSQAMNALSYRDRSLLTLRCLESLSYRQIASVMGVTQLAAKVAFFRAKRSLKRQLMRNGHGPSFLASALGVFALMTDRTAVSSHAAAVVQAGSLQVGAAASVVGSVTCKPLIAIFAVVALSLSAVPLAQHRMRTDYVHPGTQGLNDLIGTGVVAPPVTLIGADYGHDGGFLQNDVAGPSRSRVVMGDAMLPLLDSRDSRCLILRYQNSIEVGFGRDLVDGPGPDIYVGSAGCKHFYLFVTDGAASAVQIAHHVCNAREHGQYELMEFDLAGCNLPFTPKAIRLTVAGSSIPGNNLHTLCARIREPLPTQK